MNEFIKEIMQLGAMEDRACSETERGSIIKAAEEVYQNHLSKLREDLILMIKNTGFKNTL